MAKKEDPFMLTNYRFLPEGLRTRVNDFVESLDGSCKEFVTKRYMQGKTLAQVAEEMGYVERSVYSIRDRVLNLWDMAFFNKDFEYQCDRVLGVIRRYGAIEHHRLLSNLNLNRSGLNQIHLKNIIDLLVITKEIKLLIIPKTKGGRPKRKYVIANSVIPKSFFSHNLSG